MTTFSAKSGMKNEARNVTKNDEFKIIDMSRILGRHKERSDRTAGCTDAGSETEFRVAIRFILDVQLAEIIRTLGKRRRPIFQNHLPFLVTPTIFSLFRRFTLGNLLISSILGEKNEDN